MNKDFFKGCITVNNVKRRYRELAMENHPDRGGDTATMAAINEAYHNALKELDGTSSMGSDDRNHTYHYSYEREQAAMNVIRELLKHDLSGCEIRLIGNWVWVEGDTKPYRKVLKAAGLKWHSKRVAWYWAPKSKVPRRYNANAHLNDLADYYGEKTFEVNPDSEAANLQAA